MPNPGDNHTPSLLGDETEDTLYAAVGRALSRWEELEEDLADLFTCFMGSEEVVHDPRHPACRVYGSVPGFTTRADMLEAAAGAFFEKYNHPEIRRRCEEAIKQCRKLSARRNDIAHGSRFYHPDRGYYLVPGYYNSRKNAPDGDPVYEYSSEHILEYANQFAALTQVIRQLHSLSFKAREQAEPGSANRVDR
jgi:hypothetical protein